MKPSEFNPEQLLAEWFDQAVADPELIPQRMGFWFGADDRRDAGFKERYLEHLLAVDPQVQFVPDLEPADHLGLILLTDQLPRNLFRGNARAFDWDPVALNLCLTGIEQGIDQHLAPIEKMFFWMPLQHSENLAIQEFSLKQFGSLAEIDPERESLWQGVGKYAKEHHDIIARFGRFPHRNAVLERQPTQAETAWLGEGGSTFGQ